VGVRWIALGLALAVLATACGDDEGDPASTSLPEGAVGSTAEPGTGVRTTTVTLVDESRTTPATAGAGARPARELETHLYEPTGTGPFPLIVFAHGLNGHPRKFTTLHRAWAAAGYIVAAPAFPVSNDLAPGGGDFIDLGQQPADMAFVLDQLLGTDSPLTATVDQERVGAGGLSLGGATVYGLAYDDCCRDDRITAAMVLDGNELSFSPDLTRGPPVLLVHADPDPSLPYGNAVANFGRATVPAAFLTLHETAHAEPYENTVDPADDLVEAVTVAWWDRYLRDDPTAVDRMTDAVTAAGPLASWEARLG
jgi:dienelactone hydrolase